MFLESGWFQSLTRGPNRQGALFGGGIYGLYRGYIGVLYRGNIGNNGKENGNYYSILGFIYFIHRAPLANGCFHASFLAELWVFLLGIYRIGVKPPVQSPNQRGISEAYMQRLFCMLNRGNMGSHVSCREATVSRLPQQLL